MAESKIGAGHAQAMFRAGFKELAQVLPAFPGHSVQPVDELGLAGNLTPGEVGEQKGSFQETLGGMRASAVRQGPQAEQETER